MKQLMLDAVGALTLLGSVQSVAAEDYMTLAHQWAVVQYRTPEAKRLDAMSALKDEADQAAGAAPHDAQILTWDGIITSALAGLKGGLGGLSLAKEARRKLERADEMAPGALNAGAKTSLGALYAQVPGWPLGFGSRKKAKAYFDAALAIAPQDLDANYFYADYLYRQRAYRDALQAVQKALAAPPRPGRKIADEGRRGEARALLEKISDKLQG
jgi:tetratricopeptide (TPR) repeat protein